MSKPAPQNTSRALDQARQLIAEGVHLQQQNNFTEAERRYKEVLAHTPNHPDALHFLGLLRHQKDGPSAESLNLIKKSLEFGLPNAGYLCNYGKILLAHGRVDDAIDHLRTALAISPSFSDAWNCLGHAYELINMPFKACDSYRKAHRADIDSIEYAIDFIRALRSTGEFEEAAKICRQMLEKKPENWQFLFLEVMSLLDMGRIDEILAKLRSAIKVDPLSAQLHYSTGLVMAEGGNFDAAKEYFEKALKIDPKYYEVYYNLSSIQSTDSNDRLLANLPQTLRQHPPRSPQAAIAAEFTLGRLYENQADYDQAFSHFKLGNQIMRSLINYDTNKQKSYVDGLLNYLDADFVARHKQVGLETEAPIFIVGMPRSGSSLVEQILASHSRISGGGELPFLYQSLYKYAETPHAITGKTIASLSDENMRAIGEHYLTKTTNLFPGVDRITDKLPGNFMLLGLIKTLFPNAHIIHCKRDPLDTCISCFLTHFDSGHEYTYDLAEIGEYYGIYERTMNYYEEILGDSSILTINYENLVDQIETEAQKLIAFCNLEWEKSCLNFTKTPRPVKTASFYQVRQPVYTHAVGRSRNYAEHIEPLRAVLNEKSDRTGKNIKSI